MEEPVTDSRMHLRCFNEAGARTPRMDEEDQVTRITDFRASMRPGRERPGWPGGCGGQWYLLRGFNEAGARTPRMAPRWPREPPPHRAASMRPGRERPGWISDTCALIDGYLGLQ